VGRVKFAVKEIKYKENMEIDSTQTASPMDSGSREVEDFEEYEDVESIMQANE